MLCIVKGNAYGHGIEKMALLFQELGADYVGVAIPEEGVELRQVGVTIHILVLSAIADKQIAVCIDYNFTITAPSDERLAMIDIGPDGQAYIRDEVILVGKSEHQEITFFDIAKWSDTSIYELLSQISYRVPRVYVNK